MKHLSTPEKDPLCPILKATCVMWKCAMWRKATSDQVIDACLEDAKYNGSQTTREKMAESFDDQEIGLDYMGYCGLAGVPLVAR